MSYFQAYTGACGFEGDCEQEGVHDKLKVSQELTQRLFPNPVSGSKVHGLEVSRDGFWGFQKHFLGVTWGSKVLGLVF